MESQSDHTMQSKNGPKGSPKQRIAIELLIMAIIGLIFGFLGPFGTYQMPVGIRLAYWVVFIIIGYTVFRPLSICAEWLADTTKISEWVAALMASGVAALPLSFLIGFAMSGMRLDPEFFGERFLLLYLQCIVIGFGIYTAMRLVFRDDGESEEPGPPGRTNLAPAPSTPTVAPVIQTLLHKRLPVGFPERIIALSVEDHYVRVHSPDQSEMLLLRLGDAINEMEPLEGMQVHRGWWVARDAIMTSKREGRNLKLVLSNGLELPVSRSFVGKLKQTGWI